MTNYTPAMMRQRIMETFEYHARLAQNHLLDKPSIGDNWVNMAPSHPDYDGDREHGFRFSIETAIINMMLKRYCEDTGSTWDEAIDVIKADLSELSSNTEPME